MSVKSGRNSSQFGMTLIEVLIALFIVGLGLAAVIKTVDSSITNTAYSKTRTLANWVALNKANELQLGIAGNDGSSLDGTSVMAGRDWYWHITLTPTGDENIRRAEIEVRLNEDDAEPVSSLMAFVGVIK
jgi:general secretion pathway protein I